MSFIDKSNAPNQNVSNNYAIVKYIGQSVTIPASTQVLVTDLLEFSSTVKIDPNSWIDEDYAFVVPSDGYYELTISALGSEGVGGAIGYDPFVSDYMSCGFAVREENDYIVDPTLNSKTPILENIGYTIYQDVVSFTRNSTVRPVFSYNNAEVILTRQIIFKMVRL